jgi:hypothetical protein
MTQDVFYDTRSGKYRPAPIERYTPPVAPPVDADAVVEPYSRGDWAVQELTRMWGATASWVFAMRRVGEGKHALREITGGQHAKAVLEAVNSALEALGSREGARAAEARAFLTERRDAIVAALAAVDSLGCVWEQPGVRNFTGERAIAAIERLHAERERVFAARRALQLAQPSAVRELTLAIEEAEAARRCHLRELEQFRASLAMPSLPALSSFVEARGMCEELSSRLRSSKRPASALHFALDQARALLAHERGAEIARLLVCWEPAVTPKGDQARVWELRAQRYAEG